MKATEKTVKRGIYNRVPVDGGQFKYNEVGEEIINYTFDTDGNNIIIINGKRYRVEDEREFAIKILRTKIRAADGATGLIKFFMSEILDSWERKIIDNCKPLN